MRSEDKYADVPMCQCADRITYLQSFDPLSEFNTKVALCVELYMLGLIGILAHLFPLLLAYTKTTNYL
jgi:hypothetical protein